MLGWKLGVRLKRMMMIYMMRLKGCDGRGGGVRDDDGDDREGGALPWLQDEEPWGPA